MRAFLLWAVAIGITVASAVYQRYTGPTYPVSGTVTVAGKILKYSFDRSHSGYSPHTVHLQLPDTRFTATLLWRRFKTSDAFTAVPMVLSGGCASAVLPAQPAAGKLEYNVLIRNGNSSVYAAPSMVVIRFKGEVPAGVLIPHIILIFLAMLLSTRTGLEVFSNAPRLPRFTLITLFFLIGGGLVFGPIVQKFAFGEYWTGVPFGYDLTDNKTLIAFLGWLCAWFMVRSGRFAKQAVIVAALLMLVVFLIPHSMFGSELDYSKTKKEVPAVVTP